MANNIATFIALDVGTKYIGVARGDVRMGMSHPLTTVMVDGDECAALKNIVADERAEVVVVGYPRNQSGEPTAQTAHTEQFVARLAPLLECQLVYRDESLTSVLAEERLKQSKKPYQKADIDAMAACIIAEEYMKEVYHERY